jgi:hypothetical protein
MIATTTGYLAFNLQLRSIQQLLLKTKANADSARVARHPLVGHGDLPRQTTGLSESRVPERRDDELKRGRPINHKDRAMYANWQRSKAQLQFSFGLRKES